MPRDHTRRSLFICVLFVLALGIRFLTWQDNNRDIANVQSSVAQSYKDSARQLVAGDVKLFASDINHIGHPPGYPILLAAIQSALHTERRYVYVIHFFFLVFVSAALWRLATVVYGFAAGFFATHKPETPKGRFV